MSALCAIACYDLSGLSFLLDYSSVSSAETESADVY